MKLVTVLMLAALPLCCYAGVGCNVLKKVIDITYDPSVSVSDYIDDVQEFIEGEESQKAFKMLKECFLNQSVETQEKANEFQHAVYDSFWCARY
ncbi:mammaglobin-A-like [Pteronotus mesoamericanus]|uniref:mammaglobin-A-like n=1 Tax=Pteronotus mesoamericanus TaxID=1884717 RepID=UPI0023EAA2F7|nr:mammaglobin-A-like [Pteronotus parnellii mesoamericanus]